MTPYLQRMLDKLKKSLSESPVQMREDYEYFVNPVSDGVPAMNPDILDEITDAMINIGNFNCDYILAPEAMGIPIATALSLKLRIPYLVLRKRSYGLPGEIEVIKKTGYSESKIYINGLKKSDKVVIVDDIVSKGGTMRSIVHAIENEIGAEIVDIIVVFNKDAKKRGDLGFNVKSLLKIEIKNKKLAYED